MVYKDTVQFIKIMNDTYMTYNLIRDSYGNCVLAGQHYLKAHFSEEDNIVKNGYIHIPCLTALFESTLFRRGQYGKEWIHSQSK